MAEEFNNKKAPEFNTLSENKIPKENLFVAENKNVSENVNVKENLEFDAKSPRISAKNKSRNKAISVLTSSLVGVVGIIVAGMTNLVNVKFKASFNKDETELRDGKIYYSVNVSDMTEKEYLTIYEYRNGSLLEARRLEDDDGDGIIKGAFDIDMDFINEVFTNQSLTLVQFNLDLKGMVGLDVERLFGKYTVEYENKKAEFKDFSYYSNWTEDGYFYFEMDFIDNGGLFTDFEAYIEDNFNHKAYCAFSENPHDEQKIFLGSLQGTTGKFYINYKENGEPVTIGPTSVEL